MNEEDVIVDDAVTYIHRLYHVSVDEMRMNNEADCRCDDEQCQWETVLT